MGERRLLLGRHMDKGAQSTAQKVYVGWGSVSEEPVLSSAGGVPPEGVCRLRCPTELGPEGLLSQTPCSAVFSFLWDRLSTEVVSPRRRPMGGGSGRQALPSSEG